MSGCARYQSHNGDEPLGYFSTASNDGYLQVVYESWRPGSRERICGFAHRRVEELGLTDINVLSEEWGKTHEHTHVREQVAYMTKGTASSDSVIAVDVNPAYVSARVIRRCVLTLEQPAD
jgi:hypothetical protein